MKKLVVGLAALPFFAGVALAAEPLTNQQMDQVTAGAGLLSLFSLGTLGGGGLPSVFGFGTSSGGGIPVKLPGSGCGGFAMCMPAIPGVRI